MHPLLRLEMQVVDARQDLVAEGADVAIRLGDLEDSGFGARKLATLSTMLVAAPGYLAARGTRVMIHHEPSLWTAVTSTASLWEER